MQQTKKRRKIELIGGPHDGMKIFEWEGMRDVFCIYWDKGRAFYFRKSLRKAIFIQ